MGYRSDVAYTIRFKSKEHRIRFMATAALTPEIELENFKLIDATTVLISYEQAKWYDDYDWVKAHVQVLEDAKAQGCAWEFARVGEEEGDIEKDGGEGIDADGNDMDCAEILNISQYIYIGDEGKPYPIGESLTQEDN